METIGVYIHEPDVASIGLADLLVSFSLKYDGTLKVRSSEQKASLKVNKQTPIPISVGESVTINTVEKPSFPGPYTVTPALHEEKLKTKNKSMRDDVTVEPIPIIEIRNPTGGNTLVIG